MSRLLVGNAFLLASILCAVGSQLLLKALLNELQPLIASWRDIPGVLDLPRTARFLATLVLLVFGYVFWVASLTRLDLSWAYPVACSSLVLVVLFSALYLGEPLTLKTVLGSLLILAGLILIAPVS